MHLHDYHYQLHFHSFPYPLPLFASHLHFHSHYHWNLHPVVAVHLDPPPLLAVHLDPHPLLAVHLDLSPLLAVHLDPHPLLAVHLDLSPLLAVHLEHYHSFDNTHKSPLSNTLHSNKWNQLVASTYHATTLLASSSYHHQMHPHILFVIFLPLFPLHKIYHNICMDFHVYRVNHVLIHPYHQSQDPNDINVSLPHETT